MSDFDIFGANTETIKCEYKGLINETTVPYTHTQLN